MDSYPHTFIHETSPLTTLNAIPFSMVPKTFSQDDQIMENETK